MIITRAMSTQQTAITGVLRRITAGQEIKAGLCRGPGIPGERELHAVAVDAAAAGLVADVTDVMDGAVDGVRDKRVVAVGDQALVDGVADNVAEAGVEDVDAVELVVQAAGAGGDV